uniref:Uncharacterized protein n=1 Tax=uncultured prokaryote TaxID=198431 RepID=A0A0H5Q7L8_9ZZZZ|nr:hypothetical protein [uncultured prokaryote]
MKWLQRCHFCDEEYTVSSGKYSMYCSNACKQKAYRARLAKQKKAREEMRDIIVYGKVDQLLEIIPVENRDSVSEMLWKVFDKIKDPDVQIAVTSLISYATRMSNAVDRSKAEA